MREQIEPQLAGTVEFDVYVEVAHHVPVGVGGRAVLPVAERSAHFHAVVEELRADRNVVKVRAARILLIAHAEVDGDIHPVEQVAEIADKFTRNEIASTNEMRSVIGWKPVDDPRADELRNKNLNKEKNVGEEEAPLTTDEIPPEEGLAEAPIE